MTDGDKHAAAVNSRSKIEIRDVNFSYGADKTRRQVLFDCNLDLEPGKITILTGPSGSGKTTLLTLIGGLRSLQEGSVSLMGTNLQELSTRQLCSIRRKIGFIFQDHNLFDALTAIQTLRLTMQLKNDRYGRNDFTSIPMDLLQQLGLGGHEDSRPCELSTGQKQRVAIARALINRPEVVLADEPTASLDEAASRAVMEMLSARAQTDNNVVLIVSHDDRLFPSADKVVRMVDGTIFESVESL
jgi:putative ABC transport system ATP-binding protein